MNRVRMSLAAATAALFVLAGCTPPPPDIPGPSEEVVAKYSETQLQLQWDGLELPDGIERPVIEPERQISNDEYGFVIEECLQEYREKGFRTLAGHEVIEMQPKSRQQEFNENLAWYTCSARFPFDYTAWGLLSEPQIQYLYDYFRRWVVPCLVLNGFDPGTIPPREEFVRNALEGSYWTPADYEFNNFVFTQEDYEELDGKCTIYPEYLYPDMDG